MEIRQGVVAVIPQVTRLMVIQRGLLVRSPGKHCFPGGAREPGETEAEAAQREVREEVGVRVIPQRCLWRSQTPTGMRLAWWLATMAGPQPLEPNPAEVTWADWLTPRQIRQLPNLLWTNHQFLDAWQAGAFQLPDPLAW